MLRACVMSVVGQTEASIRRCGMSVLPQEQTFLRPAALRHKQPVAKPLDKTSDLIRKVKTFMPASDARRAVAVEVLGYSNVGHLGSRHT